MASPTAPPVIEPPVAPPPLEEPKEHPWKKALGPLGAVLLLLLAKGKTILGFLMPALKFLKLGKILTTASTMLLSVWFYSVEFGWSLAAGFVISILVHEMGHVVAAWRQGVPVSAPMFIPGMGALIISKGERSAWESAVIGIGGPLGGALAGLASWGLFAVTDNRLFLALAYITFFMNLFNMAPIFPMDGGRIVGAVSPLLWGLGLVLFVAMFFTGHARNPMLFILVLLSLPMVWTAFKLRGEDPFGGEPTPPKRRIGMGLAYVGLCGFLIWAMAATHERGEELRPRPASTPVAQTLVAPLGA